MQYILTEHEMKMGCELIDVWETEEMTLDDTYIEQDRLNEQGYFTIIHCTDAEQDLYKISVFQRNQ
ncbi:MAG: hypothetical protein NC417_07080 [Candidatus Gastranaerophilales bacterium]|nr:hypothetical protein [Candidatus Gastranaerophilales bacterium]